MTYPAHGSASSPSATAAASAGTGPHLQRTIASLFEEQVRQTPQNIAVEYDGIGLSYHELNRRSNQLAHYLRELGVRDGDRVGICVERSFQMITGLLGILKAGAVYTPLDPNYPQERLESMAQNAGLTVLLIQENLAGKIALPGVRLLVFEKERLKIEKQPEEKPVSHATADYPAYLIYTSGSTGKPKGVCVCHRNVARLVVNTNYADMGPHQVFLQFAPISFDASTFEIWGALLNGRRLVIFPPGTPSAEELGDWLSQHDVTTLWLTAGLFHQMMEADTGRQFRHVRQLLAGGDVLSPKLVQKFLNHYPDCRLINGYGPTENTTFSTCGELRDMPENASSVIIGKPIANSTAYVLDHDMQPAPIGDVGELYLGGNGLAHGYWNEPTLTAEKFVPNPFSDAPGERLYRSGDLGRFLANGNLEFAGRIDNQIKLRGFRIELEEIEAALAQHAEVAQAVVILRENNPGDKRIVAYVVPRHEETTRAFELRKYLSKRLPEYMVPSAFVFLSALLLTPNGKVDRKALPVPKGERSELEQAYDAPATTAEQKLSEIWAEVLRIDRVGANDNFFDLGGDSLLASKIISRMRAASGVSVSVRKFFDEPVLANLARCWEAARRNISESQIPAMGSIPHGDYVPLGSSQERIWFLQKLDPSSIAYHFQATLEIIGPLRIDALEHSLTELVSRHEILRTTFTEKDGTPFQVIHQPFPVLLSLVHFEDVQSDRLLEVTSQRIQAEITKPIDVGQLPLVRWILLSFSEQKHLLLHIEHHLIHDGWSFNVFLSELLETYNACVAGTIPQAPNRLQFADFTVWQRQYLCSLEIEPQRSYWKEKLSGSLPVSELPTDHPRPRVQTFKGGLLRIPLSLELSRSIRSFGHQEGASLFVVMMSAFFALMYHWTRQPDFCVGTSMANRHRPETERLLGMLVNNVVLRAQLSAASTFRGLVEHVRQLTFEAYENQDVPFQDVVQALNLNRDLSVNPLFQTTFNFHNSPADIPGCPELKFNLVEGVSSGGAKFDLGVIVIPSTERRLRLNPEWDKDTVMMLWEYNTDLLDESTVQRVSSYYQHMLESMASGSEQQLGEVCLLTDSEKQQVLHQWNNTQADFPGDKCAHQLFEEHACRNPNAVAAICNGSELTYEALNRRANRLAHYLRELGVKPDSYVAIAAERGFEMITAVLSVWKAGGAYVPMDPTYPVERLQFMLRDTAPLALLTQKHLRHLFMGCNNAMSLIELPPEDAAWWRGYPDTNPECSDVGLTAHDLAYVIFTSGSTGVAKGVMIEHRGVCNLARSHAVNFSVEPRSRILQFASFSFDASVFEIVMALCQGAALYLFSQETALTEAALKDAVARNAITHAVLPPAVLAYSADTSSLDPVRTLIVAGDTLSNALAERWTRGRDLINAYGPTEITVCATLYHCGTEVLGNAPIGRPICNARVNILNEFGEAVPIGVAGELYVGGAGVARGYLNQPKLTAERFVPDSYSTEAGMRLYKTGDLGRWRSDGAIEFLGRNDDQVKIRGFRIELGEIQARLTQYPGIGEAVVLAREEGAGEKRLVAYYTMERSCVPGGEEAEVEAEHLRVHLASGLPDYMVPAAYVRMEKLPLTSNGKLDRKALPAPLADAYAHPGYQAPQGELESTLCGIWSELLRLDRVGRHDNFFQLGGHSLLATRMVSRVRSVLGVELVIQNVFEFPTVASLAPIAEKLILDEIAQMPEAEAIQIAGQLSEKE